jgi:hypothetical protein
LGGGGDDYTYERVNAHKISTRISEEEGEEEEEEEEKGEEEEKEEEEKRKRKRIRRRKRRRKRIRGRKRRRRIRKNSPSIWVPNVGQKGIQYQFYPSSNNLFFTDDFLRLN